MKEYILNELQTSLNIKKNFIEENVDLISKALDFIKDTIITGNKILFFGNGGSAADSQHLAAEFVNRLGIERKALPAISLTTDTSVITCLGNDRSFDEIFSRQIEALGNEKDLAIGISTSGNSENIIKAFYTAKQNGLKTIAFTGGDGGKILEESLADVVLNVSGSKFSARIQETHIFIGHILIELMDKDLF